MQQVWKGPALRAAAVLAGLAVLTPVRAPAAGEAAKAKAEASEARLRKDIFFLGSDDCEGRGPTTRGINKAADYIAAEFKKAGLKPAGDAGTYFQHFSIPGARLVRPATLTLRGPQGQEVVLRQG